MIFIRERIFRTASALFVGAAIVDVGAWWFLSLSWERIIGQAFGIFGCAGALYFQFRRDHVAVRLTEYPKHYQREHNGYHSIP